MTFKKRLVLALFTSFSFFNFLSAQTFYIQEDFNAGSLPTGWSNSALSGSDRWLFGNDGSSLHPGNNSIDSSNFAYFDDDNLSGTSLNNTTQLSTPIFNNSSNSTSFLEFDYNFRDYDLSNTSDSLYVEVFDGSNWNLVFSTSVDDCGRYTGPNPTDCEINGFPHAKIDISSYANSTCIVRFIYHDGDDWSWYAGIDNVEIYSPEPNDIGVVSIENPKQSSCKLSSSEFISCTIKNFSADTINSFELIARVDSGNQQIVDTVTSQLLPLDSIQYTFTKGVDLSLSKAYHLSVHSKYTLDQKANNDSNSVSIPARSFKSLPYFEGFESNNHDWELSGDSISWERGAPNGNFINSAAKGSNAFVTNLDGNYTSNEFSYLTSPCIELDSINSKLLLSVDLTFDTEGGFDPFYLEFSNDGGTTWQKVNQGLAGFNWYNLSSAKIWGGKRIAWRNYSTTFIGQSTTVKFRFVFKSDAINHFEGVGVDNFSLRPVYSKDLKLVKLLSPPEKSSNQCGLSNSEEVSVKILSFGLNAIDTFKVAYQVDNTNPVSAQPNLLINSDTSLTYSFQTKADLFTHKTFALTIFIEFLSEGVWHYDTITKFINNEYYVQKNLPYLETFDNMVEISDFKNNATFSDSLSTEWSRDPSFPNFKRYMWVVAKDSAYGGYGPLTDHTGNNGNYIISYRVGDGNSTISYVATISSPCLLINSQNPELSFWYHRSNVYTNAPLYIDVFSDNAWSSNANSRSSIVDSILIDTPATQADHFIQHKIDLSIYQSKKIKIRFRQFTPIGYPAVAVDDFHVYDSTIVTGIEPIELGDNKFTLYPNPNQGEFTLRANKELIGSKFEVYNLSGQLLTNKLLDRESIQLNLSEFGKGIYFIRFPQLNLTEKLVVY